MRFTKHVFYVCLHIFEFYKCDDDRTNLHRWPTIPALTSLPTPSVKYKDNIVNFEICTTKDCTPSPNATRRYHSRETNV